MRPPQIETARVDQRFYGDDVRIAPFGRDPDPRFPHEGGRKREGQRLAVETREHDLTARSEPADERVQDPAVAAHIADRSIVATASESGVMTV